MVMALGASTPITTAAVQAPRKDVMGSFLHDGGCTFRVWAPFARAVSLRLFGSTAPAPIPMNRDSADSFGNDVWSVFVPSITEDTHYRYLLTLQRGSPAERVDPFARSIVFPNFTAANQDDTDARSVVTDHAFDFGHPFQAPGWRELVIYQLHVGTFYDASQGSTDQISKLIAQVPYLRDLGVNAVQLLPFVEFSAPLSLGYDPVLPFALERDYGRPQDFKRLVQAMHGAGIAVLVDVVFNHIDVSDGSGRVFPYGLFQYDGFDQDDCGIFFYGGEEKNTPFGGPRPNYGRAAVRRFLSDNVMLWLEEYQVDGVRFDSTGCIRKRQGPCGTHCCGRDIGVERNLGWEMMQQINDRVEATQPWKLTIAEDLDGNSAITNPTSTGGAGFDAQWDTDVQDALMAAITQAKDDDIDVERVAEKLRQANGDPFARIIYLESHDQAKSQRVPERIFPGDAEGTIARRKSILGFAVVMTTPGIPMFFQGAELLDIRRWEAGGSNPTTMDFARRALRSRLFQCYGDLVRLRKSAPGLAGAGINVFVANPSTKVMAYHRWNQGSGADDLVVVVNFSGIPFPSYTIGFPFAGTWFVRVNTDANVYSDANDFASVNSFDTNAGTGGYDGMPFSGNVGIGPFSVLVLGR